MYQTTWHLIPDDVDYVLLIEACLSRGIHPVFHVLKIIYFDQYMKWLLLLANVIWVCFIFSLMETFFMQTGPH